MISIIIHEHLYIHIYESLYRSIVVVFFFFLHKVVAGIIRLSSKFSYTLLGEEKKVEEKIEME